MTNDKAQLKSTNVVNDDMRITDEIEKRMYHIIMGAKRTSMRMLGMKIGLTDRQVRKKIEMMRRNGVRIGSDEKGYFICKTDGEFNKFYNKYISSAISTLEIASSMRHNNNEQVIMDE